MTWCFVFSYKHYFFKFRYIWFNTNVYGNRVNRRVYRSWDLSPCHHARNVDGADLINRVFHAAWTSCFWWSEEIRNSSDEMWVQKYRARTESAALWVPGARVTIPRHTCDGLQPTDHRRSRPPTVYNSETSVLFIYKRGLSISRNA